MVRRLALERRMKKQKKNREGPWKNWEPEQSVTADQAFQTPAVDALQSYDPPESGAVDTQAESADYLRTLQQGLSKFAGFMGADPEAGPSRILENKAREISRLKVSGAPASQIQQAQESYDALLQGELGIDPVTAGGYERPQPAKWLADALQHQQRMSDVEGQIADTRLQQELNPVSRQPEPGSVLARARQAREQGRTTVGPGAVELEARYGRGVTENAGPIEALTPGGPGPVPLPEGRQTSGGEATTLPMYDPAYADPQPAKWLDDALPSRQTSGGEVGGLLLDDAWYSRPQSGSEGGQKQPAAQQQPQPAAQHSQRLQRIQQQQQRVQQQIQQLQQQRQPPAQQQRQPPAQQQRQPPAQQQPQLPTGAVGQGIADIVNSGALQQALTGQTMGTGQYQNIPRPGTTTTRPLSDQNFGQPPPGSGTVGAGVSGGGQAQQPVQQPQGQGGETPAQNVLPQPGEQPPVPNPQDFVTQQGGVTTYNQQAYNRALEQAQMWPYLEELGGARPSLERFSTLDPIQQDVQAKLGQYLTNAVGQPLDAYQGQAAAGPSVPEQIATQRLNQYLAGPGNPQYAQQLSAMGRAMQGQLPGSDQYQNALAQAMQGEPSTDASAGATRQLFQEGVAEPAREQFYDETLGQLGEEFVGPGTYWSSARMRAQQDAANEFERNLAQQRARVEMQDLGQRRQLYESGAQRALQAAQAAQSGQLGIGSQALQAAAQSAQTTDPALQQAQAGMQLGQLPRQLTQQELDRQYEEYLRTRPSNAPQLQQAMQLLGQSTMGTYFQQPRLSPGAQYMLMQYPQSGSGVFGVSPGPSPVQLGLGLLQA